jgi:hypothetical protein
MDGTEEYLTPTQRANRQIRRLKVMNNKSLVSTSKLTISFTNKHSNGCNGVKTFSDLRTKLYEAES